MAAFQTVMYVGEEEDDSDSEGWNEMETDLDTGFTCLFCPQNFKTMAIALEHCKSDHNFDLIGMKRRFSMDCYSYICLINYIRKSKAAPADIAACTSPVWHTSENFAPVIPDDPWLSFDFEGLDTPAECWDLSPELESVCRTEDGFVKMNDTSYIALLNRIQFLNKGIKNKEMELYMATEQIKRMREVTQKLISNENEGNVADTEARLVRLNVSHDSDYFGSYSHFGIHLDMLSDRTRTESYRDAITKNVDLFHDKVVLDIGCGSGILSLFCAKNGAAKVFAVDQSDIIYHAMDIIRENKMENIIELIKERVENVNLNVPKVDIILSEWMGYFLFYEGMLDSVLCARDKFLKSNGHIFPNRCNMSLVAVSDSENHKAVVEFWDDVYGFKMTTLKNEVLKEAFISVVPSTAVASKPAIIHEINLATCTVESSNFESSFELHITKTCSITALCGYFDTFFDFQNPIQFSTGPDSRQTHWKQTVFHLPSPIAVTNGSTLNGTISCQKQPNDARALAIELTIASHSLSYRLS